MSTPTPQTQPCCSTCSTPQTFSFERGTVHEFVRLTPEGWVHSNRLPEDDEEFADVTRRWACAREECRPGGRPQLVVEVRRKAT